MHHESAVAAPTQKHGTLRSSTYPGRQWRPPSVCGSTGPWHSAARASHETTPYAGAGQEALAELPLCSPGSSAGSTHPASTKPMHANRS